MPLVVFGAISAAAAVINGIINIIHNGHVDDQLDRIIKQLQQLRDQLVTGIAQILEAIDGVRREVDHQVALSAIALVDRALYNDAAIFNDEEQALGNSFQAANLLYQETDNVFLSSFLYVVTLRLAILKGLRPSYYCEVPFEVEYQGYINKANGWIQPINDAITASHTVRVELERRGGTVNPQSRWVATHFRNRVAVDSFVGAWDDTSEETRASVEQQANASRARGIQKDRQDFGVVDMENTVAAWREAFHGALRVALVREVLNRPTMAIDFNPDGLMVDGRILPAGLDQRATLLELLSSREFRNRIQKTWDTFMNHDDDRLVQFAYRRLFNRDANSKEINLLRGIASHYGYGAFIAALLYCKEYEERYGRGLPAGGEPILKVIESEERSRTQG